MPSLEKERRWPERAYTDFGPILSLSVNVPGRYALAAPIRSTLSLPSIKEALTGLQITGKLLA